MLMEINMRGIGKMIEKMGKVYIHIIVRVKNMKVLGNMVIKMVMEYLLLHMAINISKNKKILFTKIKKN